MLLTVGRIVRPHGVRGEVMVEVGTDEPQLRYRPGTVLATGPPAARGSGPPPQVPDSLTVDSTRPHRGRLIVRFAEVVDRDAAESLRDVRLWVDSAQLADPADPEEFHDHQLVGLAAVDPGGEPVGTVTRIEHGPSADLLVLDRVGGGTALVPFVRAIVPEVDLPGGRVVVDPPPGLLDL